MSVAAATVPDDVRYEVVDGEIREKTFEPRESEIASLLLGYLFSLVRARRLGRLLLGALFRIDQTRDLQRRPDVAFISNEKWPFNRRAPNVNAWEIVPDLAIEIVNSTDSAAEVQTTIHDYFDAGVSKVWVVYPEHKNIYVHASPTKIQVLQLGDELDGGDLLPGFRLPLSALFEDDPE
jgi:Uma2 family endonuclease